MSVDISVYISPYLVCSFGNVDEKILIYGCEKCKKELDTNLKYCSICGKKLGNYSIVKSKISVVVEDVLEQIDYNLEDVTPEDYEEKVNLFVPKRLNNKDTYFNPRGEEGIININLNQEMEMQLFLKEYEKEIEIIKKLYPKVEVKYGIINYISY